MPISVNWYDDEHSIVIITIRTDTIWEEYHQAIDWIVTEAKKVDHRIDLIFHDEVGMPRGNPMPHLSRGSGKIISQPNIHLVIIAGSQGYSGFVRMMLEALARTYMKMPRSTGGALLFIRTLEEALARIQQDRIRSSTT